MFHENMEANIINTSMFFLVKVDQSPKYIVQAKCDSFDLIASETALATFIKLITKLSKYEM